jgi:hypothetical protein
MLFFNAGSIDDIAVMPRTRGKLVRFSNSLLVGGIDTGESLMP